MASELTHEDVRRIAELARLELGDADVEKFGQQINDILEYAAQLQQIDTAGVAPTAHVLGVVPAWRDDVPNPSLDRTDALSNAPDADRRLGLFKVPKVL